MASFRAKIGGKSLRKRENKNYRSVSFVPDAVIENSKKIANKFQKLKNTIMTSFQAPIDREWPRKIENKNYRSVPLLPDA